MHQHAAAETHCHQLACGQKALPVVLIAMPCVQSACVCGAPFCITLGEVVIHGDHVDTMSS